MPKRRSKPRKRSSKRSSRRSRARRSYRGFLRNKSKPKVPPLTSEERKKKNLFSIDDLDKNKKGNIIDILNSFVVKSMIRNEGLILMENVFENTHLPSEELNPKKRTGFKLFDEFGTPIFNVDKLNEKILLQPYDQKELAAHAINHYLDHLDRPPLFEKNDVIHVDVAQVEDLHLQVFKAFRLTDVEGHSERMYKIDDSRMAITHCIKSQSCL